MLADQSLPQFTVIKASEFERIPKSETVRSLIMTNSAEQQVIDLGGEQYAFDSLSDQAKELVNGLQVADAQLQITHDKLNVMMFARRSLLDQLAEELKDVEPVKGS